MQHSQKWRTLLGNIIRDPKEKQRIAAELGVSQMTLARWVNGGSNPRVQNFRLLLSALPDYRLQFLEALPEEFRNSLTEFVDVHAAESEIPAAFYIRVLNAHCRLPRILHFSSIVDIILQQALKQLDASHMGMEITLVQCMYPSADRKIRSLRECMGRGTPPWKRELEEKTFFLGSETLAGYVVTTGRPIAIQKRSEEDYLFPVRWVRWEECVMAYPIMLADKIAGCLLVSCTQPYHFVSEVRRSLVQQFAELLTLAFAPDAFYDLCCIDLGLMPPYEEQQPYLATFRKRTSELVKRLDLNMFAAQREAWQQIEEELLRHQRL